MILTPTPGARKPLREDSDPSQAEHDFPPALTRLARWGVYRSRVKKYKDRDRPVFEAFHPATGHELPVHSPDAWVTYAEACNPRGRKPYHGVGFLVRRDDGLAVVRNATREQAELLAEAVVHLMQEVGGVGLVLVVHAGVHGAKTDCFVPLSGRSPYQGEGEDFRDGFPDGVRTDSGRERYQAEAVSGRERYQGEGPTPDGARILLSSSPPEINGEGVETKPVEDMLAELAKEILEQGMSRGTDDNWRWLYSIISLLQVRGLKTDDITPHLLRKTAETLGVDADDLQARVVARWRKLDPSRGLLADALRAVRADASLLKDLPVANSNALLIAGMARYMGRDGKPFRLHQVSLAQVLGLSGQKAVSPLVLSLREKGWLTLVGAHKYAGPKPGRLAAEYIWTGPGAVEPSPAAVSVAVPGRAAVPHPPPRVPVAPPPSPRRAGVELRPGHASERQGDQKYESRFGGYLTVDYYLAEVMVARRLKRQGEDLFETFWWESKLGKENEGQAAAARKLLKVYPEEAILAAINAPDAKSVYTLWPGFVGDLVKKKVPVALAKQAVLAVRVKQAAAAPPPPPSGPQAPRPAMKKKSLLSKLKGT